ncbi:MAG: fibronectin type III domain-containing protein [Propionibacteriaceae bacterium]|nr:fibronectin type III domain-containing protein [Propionibacteriaceae bacterium]
MKRLITALASLALTASAFSGAPAVAAPIDTTSLDAVTEAYLYEYLPALDVPIGWTGSTASCDPGAPSVAAQAATFTSINFFRKLAGLPEVTENTAGFDSTQKAALMLQANGKLDHNRDNTWSCYTTGGAEKFPAGASGEIIAALPGANSVWLYVQDPGTNNRALGHRAQILDGGYVSFASGSTSSYNVMHGYSGVPTTPLPDSWSWPSAGYVPYQLAQTTAPDWSFYLKTGSTSAASVTVTKNGATVAVSDVRQVNDGIGWVMPTLAKPTPGTPDVYHVTVSGVTGASASTYEYDVKVFTIPTVALGNVTVSGKRNVGETLQISVGTLEPGATVTYQWARAACTSYCTNTGTVVSYPHFATPVPIEGATSSSYTLTAADEGAGIFVKVSATKHGYYPATTSWVGANGAGVVGTDDLVGAKIPEPTTSGTSVTPSGNDKNTTTVPALSKVKIKSLTVGKKTLTVKWQKSPATDKVTKYQIQYRLKGKSAWTSKKVASSKASLKLTKLKKGKVYQVRIRAIRVVSSGAAKGNYYSAWSAVKASKKVK